MIDTPKEPTPLNNAIGIPLVTLERFMAKIDRKSSEVGCWLWTASTGSTGYGQFRFGDPSAAPWKAHRLSYALTFGMPSGGSHIHHECGNETCVNPAHLREVSPREHIVELTEGSASYIAARRTHCPAGHEYTPENTAVYRGKRDCRECNRIQNAAAYKRFREANPIPEKETFRCGHSRLDPANVTTYPKNGKRYEACKQCRMEKVKQYQKANRRILHAKERVREKLRDGNHNLTALEFEAMGKLKNFPPNNEN